MTEEEAMKKKCPMMLSNHSISGYCLGSDCMAWIWEENHWQYLDKYGAQRDENGNIIPPIKYGFCGMAGKLIEHKLGKIHEALCRR